MLTIKMNRFKIFLICFSILLTFSCKEPSEAEKLRQYLASINAASGSAITPGTSTIPSVATIGVPPAGTAALPPLGANAQSATAILHGTPKQITGGVCGDGIINGPNEDCDQGAIQNTACADYGGVNGVVSCQPNCLYDISQCVTPAVDAYLGGHAESCKCHCNSSRCGGGCRPAGSIGQALCDFDCDNECICQCEGKMQAHVEDCEFRCACTIDATGSPACECNLDECDLLVTLVPNLTSLINVPITSHPPQTPR